MTTFWQLPDIVRALSLSLYFAAFIALLFLMILRLTRLRRLRPCPMCALFPPIIAFMIIFLMEGQQHINMGSTPSGFGTFVGDLPWLLHALILTSAIFYSGIGFLKEKKIAETEITPDSVREALDNLPSGLCFSDRDGFPLLTNRRMYNLAQDLDGGFMQNVEILWQSLANFKERNGIERIQDGHAPVLRWPDGSVWRFSKTELSLSDRQYVQTTAANITNLHRISTQLAKSNIALEQQQIRLKKLIERMIENTREEEILAVKVHIHNELGRCILAGRRSLKEPSKEKVEQALILWCEVANRLAISAADTTPNAGEALRQISGIAALLGCIIDIEGELPRDEDTAYLLLTAVREGVTNAVRHAGASRVTVKLKQQGNILTAQIADNGTGCFAEITEGGGLTSLRNQILQAGGELNILCNERVSLHLRLPLMRQED